MPLRSNVEPLRHRPYGLYHVPSRPLGVDATSTSYEQHGWDIHAL